MKQQKYIWITALLLLALLSGCSKDNDKDTQDSDSGKDRQTVSQTEDTPSVTDTAPVITDAVTTEPIPEETVTETTEPPETDLIVTLPAETEEETISVTIPAVEPETDTEHVTEPTLIPTVPVETVRQYIDITDKVTAGGEAVTGQFVSAQSKNIQLVVDYKLETAENWEQTLTLDVGLSCYELYCGEKTDMGTITVDGVSHNFSTEAITHVSTEKTYIPFFTQTYTCTGNLTANIDVSWIFNGNYGGVDIGTLSAGAVLQWGSAGACLPDNPPVTEDTAAAEDTAALTDIVTDAVTETVTEAAAEPAVTEQAETEAVIVPLPGSEG